MGRGAGWRRYGWEGRKGVQGGKQGPMRKILTLLCFICLF